MHAAPGYAPCSHLLSCTGTNSWLRPNLVTRHCTCAQNQAPARGQIPSPKPHCTATAPVRNIIPAVTAKTRAIPGLHREKFLAKVPGLCPVLRQVPLTNYTAGPLGLRDKTTNPDIQHTKARVWLTPNTCFFPIP